jgi:hypothetical protein
LSVDDVEGATRCRDSVAALFDDEGFLGEQFGGDRRDPKHYQEWVDRWGPPARDLTWSHAMFVVLSIALKEYDTSNRVGAVTSMSGDDESRENSRRTG